MQVLVQASLRFPIHLSYYKMYRGILICVINHMIYNAYYICSICVTQQLHPPLASVLHLPSHASLYLLMIRIALHLDMLRSA